MIATKQFIESELERINRVPQFQAHTYEEQQALRAHVVATIISEDERMKDLSPQELAEVTDSVVGWREPALETDSGRQAATPLFNQVREGKLDSNTVANFSMMQGLISNGLLANVVGRPAAKVADIITGNDGDAAAFQWQNIIDLHTGSDGDKIESYLQEQARRNRMGSVAGTYKGLGSVAGFIGDLVVFHGAFEKISATPMKEAGKAIAMKLPGRVGTWTGKVALPAFVSGTSSGAYGIVREEILAEVNNDDARKQDSFRKMARTFGEWALIDYAVNLGAGTVLPHLTGSWRRAFGKAKESKPAIAAKSPEELRTLIDQVTNGEVPAPLWEQFDDATRHWLKGRADLNIAASRVSKAVRENPYDDLLLNANGAGMTVTYDASVGKYYSFTPESAGSLVMDEFDDLISVNRKVSNKLLERYKGLDASEQKEFLKRYRNALQYEATDRLLNGGLDPLKVKGQLGPKQADELAALRSARAKDFVSPLDRPYVGRGEAEAFSKVLGKTGHVQVMKVKLPDEALSNVKQGKAPFTTGKSVRLVATEQGDEVLAMVRNPAPKEAVRKATVHAQKALASGTIAESETTLRNMYLMESGFDGIIENADTVQMFYPDKLKIIATEFNPHLGKIGKVTADFKAAEPTIQSTVRRSFRATVSGDEFARSNKLVTAVASDMKGDLNGKDIEKMTRTILAGKGVDASKITVKLTDATDVLTGKDYAAQAIFKGGQVELRLPSRISTPKAQKKLIKELFDPAEGEFKNIIDTLGDASKAKSMVYPKLTKKMSAVFKSPFSDPASTEKWLKSGVEDISKGVFNKTAKGYQVKLPGKNPIEATTLDQLVDRVMLETVDFPYLKFDLARRGYKIEKVSDGFIVRGKGLDKPIKGNSVNEVAEQINYRPKKISNKFAPQVSMLDMNAVEVRFDNGMAVGDKKGISQMLSNFEDMDYVARLKKIGNYDTGEVFITPSGAYEVEMPEFGIIKKFSSAQEANRFMRHTYKQMDSLKDIAGRKGLQMWYTGTSIKVSDGATTYSAKNRDEVLRIFKDYPDSRGAQELAADAVDEDSLNVIDRVLKSFDDSKIPVQNSSPVHPYGDINQRIGQPVKDIGAMREVQAMFDTMDHFVETAVKKTGATDLVERYRDLKIAHKAARSATDKAETAVKVIFTDKKGKMIPLDRRQAIFYHSGAQTPEEELFALATFKELTEEDKTVATNLRRLLGSESDGVITGLAGVFGIPPEKFIKNYMPRIMDWSVKHSKEVAGMVTADELIEAAMKDAYSGGVVKQLKAFFKNMRVSEALEFAAIDDPVRALQHYIRVGYRQHYMGRAWENLYDSLAKSGLGVDSGVYQRFNRYRELVMGLQTGDGHKTARRIGEDIGKALKMKNGGNMVDAYFSMNYFANMGYRPWLALRNTYQVFTTLAPRIGNSWVDEGIHKANKMSKADYEFLQKVGVTKGEPPIVNTILDADSAFGNLTHKSLSMFKSSDEYTRAVAFHSAASRFDFALEKWRKGGIKNMDGFLKEAGITKMDSDTINRVKALMDRGTDESVVAAKTLFGTKLSDETMFEYVKEQAPTIHTGSFFGEMFGQYGTYAAGYRANIMRGISNGNFADKAAFAARSLANQTALFAAFSAIGVKATNFIPGLPALFGGGPQFEASVAALQSMGSGYQARQARSQLLRKFSPVGYNQTRGLYANYPEMWPGSIQFRYAAKALEYAEKGDYWQAFLAATTTPVTDPDSSPFR